MKLIFRFGLARALEVFRENARRKAELEQQADGSRSSRRSRPAAKGTGHMLTERASRGRMEGLLMENMDQDGNIHARRWKLLLEVFFTIPPRAVPASRHQKSIVPLNVR